MTIGKAKIVDELAGSAVLLPDLVAAALGANARIKFALSWLQTAEAVGRNGTPGFADLAPERAMAGLSGASDSQLETPKNLAVRAAL